VCFFFLKKIYDTLEILDTPPARLVREESRHLHLGDKGGKHFFLSYKQEEAS
jgi:hypothetical protein